LTTAKKEKRTAGTSFREKEKKPSPNALLGKREETKGMTLEKGDAQNKRLSISQG